MESNIFIDKFMVSFNHLFPNESISINVVNGECTITKSGNDIITFNVEEELSKFSILSNQINSMGIDAQVHSVLLNLEITL